MEEYKKDLTEKLQAEKIEAAKTADEDKVVAKVIENATMEIPDQMVEEQVNGMVNDYARRLESQGISFKQYVEITGMTAEKIGEQMKPQAIKRIQTRLVLEAVVRLRTSRLTMLQLRSSSTRWLQTSRWIKNRSRVCLVKSRWHS